jgi:type VI secretion system protein ImpJ
MFLRPQHFQQQERFLEALTERRTSPLRPHAWGITELELNEDLLAVGKFGLSKVSVIMPDGTAVTAPGDADLPPPLDVPSDARNAIVYLSLPPRQPGTMEFIRGSAGAGTRYAVSEQEAIDVFSEMRSSEQVETAQPNLRLGITKEQTEGRVLAGLGRIVERRDQLVVLDCTYIPSSLTLEAHPTLVGIVDDIGGRASARADELAKRAVAKVEAGAETLTSFLMLQSLNRWTPLLRHLRTCPGHHPETLYATLLQLAGEIATFTTTARRPPVFPDYNHLDLRLCFAPVVDFLVGAFSAVFDRAAVQLDVEMRQPGAYICPIRDRGLFRSSTIFLAIAARRPPKEIAERFAAQLKVGSVTQMRELVRSAVGGVSIRHVTTLPPQMPAFHEMTYFQIDQSGPEWRDIAATAPAIGLAVAGDWPELRLEMWAVRRPGA